jgi:aconitate hydratase
LAAASSRKHAAIAPRYPEVRAVIAKSFARIHRHNLINFGILPLTFVNPDDWENIEAGDVLRLLDVREALRHGNQLKVINQTEDETYATERAMTARQVEMILAGNLVNLFRARYKAHKQTT